MTETNTAELDSSTFWNEWSHSLTQLGYSVYDALGLVAQYSQAAADEINTSNGSGTGSGSGSGSGSTSGSGTTNGSPFTSGPPEMSYDERKAKIKEMYERIGIAKKSYAMGLNKEVLLRISWVVCGLTGDCDSSRMRVLEPSDEFFISALSSDGWVE